MKRVLYFSDAPYVGGAEKYLMLLARSIRDFGYNPFFILNNKENLDALAGELKAYGIAVYGANIDLPGSLRGLPEFVRLIRKLSCDIFHINLPGPYSSRYSLVAPIAKLCGVRKVVSTEHLPMVEPFLKGKLLKSISNLFIDRVITVSENNVRFLVEKHGVKRDKVRVVYLGIPDIFPYLKGSREEFGLGQDDISISVIGSLEERKGQSVAVEALKMLPKNYHLLVAGTGPAENRLRHLVDELKLSERVHFLGYVDDIATVMGASDIVLLTSIMEATPFVLIEAMSAGIPVVASGVYGVGEIVKDSITGILVPPGDAKKTAEAIERIMSDQKLRKRMSKAARELYLSRFRIDRFASQTARIYDELLGLRTKD